MSNEWTNFLHVPLLLLTSPKYSYQYNKHTTGGYQHIASIFRVGVTKVEKVTGYREKAWGWETIYQTMVS